MAKAIVTVKKSGESMGKKPAAAKKNAAVKKITPAGKKGLKSKKASAPMRYKCRVCGYVYSPLRGEPHNGIPAGTAFEDLPDTYVCPVCGFEGKGKVGTWGFDEWRPTRYICSMCDYIYDENRGEPHRGIKPGTKFEDLPEDYICPVCATDPKIVLRYGNVLKQGFSPLYD
jgi:rubredoxin